jgi:hypothetical protein
MDVAEGEITDTLPDSAKVVRGKTAALPHKVIWPGVKQEHMDECWVQLLNYLANLVWCGGSEVTSAGEAHAIKIGPSAAPGILAPGLHERPFGAELGGEQDEQIVVCQIFEPSLLLRIDGGFIVVPGDSDHRDPCALKLSKHILGLPEVRRLHLWAIEQVPCEETGIGPAGDGFIGYVGEGGCEVGIWKAAIEPPPSEMNIRCVD